jgi:hypothetical protein
MDPDDTLPPSAHDTIPAPPPVGVSVTFPILSSISGNNGPIVIELDSDLFDDY